MERVAQGTSLREAAREARLMRMMHGKVASALASWVRMVQVCKEEESEKKRQEVILQRSERSGCLALYREFMNRWCEMVSERKHMRRLVKKVIGQLMNGLSGSAFRTWTCNVTEMKAQEEEAKRQAVIFERIRRRWLNQATGAAYRSWLEFVFERKRVRGLVKKCHRAAHARFGRLGLPGLGREYSGDGRRKRGRAAHAADIGQGPAELADGRREQRSGGGTSIGASGGNCANWPQKRSSRC